MKQFLLFASFISLSLFSFGQLSFSKMSDSLTLENGVQHKAKIVVSNNSGVPITLRWTQISSTLLDNDGAGSPFWLMQFCECVNCYSNDFSALTSSGGCLSPMADGDAVEWYLTVDPNGAPFMDAEYVIEVEDMTNNKKDTLSYLVKNPTSVNNLNAFAQVTSYPNPANMELVVTYKLANASTPVLNIFSLLGAKVASYTLNNGKGSLTVNTSSLSEGMYFYSIENNGQRVHTQKFNVVH